MSYTYREKNIYGKLNFCGCDNERTRAFCENDFCAELAQDGTIIYRGEPRRNINIDGYTLRSPPLRNEGGYDNANGSGLYDNVNKSIGHRAPCNLELEIFDSVSQNWCNDCEDLNGTYDSIHILDLGYGIGDGSLDGGYSSMWFWPLCRPDKIGNSCGASYAYGYMDFDDNDGFVAATDTVRDVYFHVNIQTQAIDPLSSSSTSLCAGTTISGCPTLFNETNLIKKKVKIGEVKYKHAPYFGYYDSNINCTSWSGLIIADQVSKRPFCDMNFKITSKNNDDLYGLKKAAALQELVVAFDGYAGVGYHGLRYNACPDNNSSPSELGIDTTRLVSDLDPYWNNLRVYEKKPHFFKVTISGATGKASLLNDTHYLFVYKNELSDGHVIQKEFNKYDSPVSTEVLYGDNEPIACAACDPKIDDICISEIRLAPGNSDTSTMSMLLTITGGNSTYGSFTLTYNATCSQSNNKGWILSTCPLTYQSASGAAANTLGNECNLKGLTIIVENGNAWADVLQLPCFPVPRNSICEGGKEPDAFLVEFTDSWDVGYLHVRRPVYWDDAVRGGIWGACYGCNGLGQCDNTNVLKTIGNCYLCESCYTNCDNQSWSGPVGSYLLTKIDNSVVIENNSCYPVMDCNHVYDPITYAYKNGSEITVCNWTSISLHFSRGVTYPCSASDNPSGIGIAMRVHWGERNTQEDPGITYCQELGFHPSHCLLCGSASCVRASSGPDVACSGTLTCPVYTESCTGRCIESDPGSPSYNDGRFFYKNLTFSSVENFTYINCVNPAGYDLTWYDNSNHGSQCAAYIGYCGDEAAPVSPVTAHGNWSGGTVKVTPVYY